MERSAVCTRQTRCRSAERGCLKQKYARYDADMRRLEISNRSICKRKSCESVCRKVLPPEQRLLSRTSPQAQPLHITAVATYRAVSQTAKPQSDKPQSDKPQSDKPQKFPLKSSKRHARVYAGVSLIISPVLSWRSRSEQ